MWQIRSYPNPESGVIQILIDTQVNITYRTVLNMSVVIANLVANCTSVVQGMTMDRKMRSHTIPDRSGSESTANKKNLRDTEKPCLTLTFEANQISSCLRNGSGQIRRTDR